jgi:hypothetical protein
MALKTFCDRCKKEIPMKKGRQIKHELEFTRIEETEKGSLLSDTTLKVEVCQGCRAEIGAAVTKLLQRYP